MLRLSELSRHLLKSFLLALRPDRNSEGPDAIRRNVGQRSPNKMLRADRPQRGARKTAGGRRTACRNRQDAPLACSDGIWTNWTSVRKVKGGETANNRWCDFGHDRRL
jgi:hypothetical protein